MKSNYILCAITALLPVAALANLPHAFSYGGMAFSNPMSAEKVVSETSSRKTVVHEWSSPDGKLILRSTETVYKNFPVREYLPELACVGDTPTDIIDNFRSLYILRDTDNASVRALRGTVC